MDKNRIINHMESNPIIAAIRNESDIDTAIASPVGVVFLLHADIFSIQNHINRFHSAGKDVLVHVDMLEGIGRDAKAIQYIADVIRPSGILTTKNQHVKHAKDNGLYVIQRFFLIDRQSFDMALHTVQSTQPDMVELMPALMPDIISQFCKRVNVPVIAGGLIRNKEDIVAALNAGAMGVSTGNASLWNL